MQRKENNGQKSITWADIKVFAEAMYQDAQSIYGDGNQTIKQVGVNEIPSVSKTRIYSEYPRILNVKFGSYIRDENDLGDVVAFCNKQGLDQRVEINSNIAMSKNTKRIKVEQDDGMELSYATGNAMPGFIRAVLARIKQEEKAEQNQGTIVDRGKSLFDIIKSSPALVNLYIKQTGREAVGLGNDEELKRIEREEKPNGGWNRKLVEGLLRGRKPQSPTIDSTSINVKKQGPQLSNLENLDVRSKQLSQVVNGTQQAQTPKKEAAKLFHKEDIFGEISGKGGFGKDHKDVPGNVLSSIGDKLDHFFDGMPSNNKLGQPSNPPPQLQPYKGLPQKQSFVADQFKSRLPQEKQLVPQPLLVGKFCENMVEKKYEEWVSLKNQLEERFKWQEGKIDQDRKKSMQNLGKSCSHLNQNVDQQEIRKTAVNAVSEGYNQNILWGDARINQLHQKQSQINAEPIIQQKLRYDLYDQKDAALKDVAARNLLSRLDTEINYLKGKLKIQER